MKKNRLPDTDVANFAALEPRIRRQELEAFKVGYSRLSYGVVRRYLPDLLGLSSGPFDLGGAKLEALLEQITRECKATKDDVEVKSNVAVARGVRAMAEELRIVGRTDSDLAPRRIGGEYIGCWNRLVLNVDGRPVIPFFDPRRSSKKLTTLGKRVAFSLMHQSIRLLNDDYATVQLAIVQFDDAKKGLRTARITYDDGFELFTYDELDFMIADTYRQWVEVCEGREEDARRYDDEHDDAVEELPMARIWRKKS